MITAPAPSHWDNLLWAVSAPSLVTADAGLPLLSPGRRQALADFFHKPGCQQALAPQLEARFAARAPSRLGLYFEDLWAFALEHHPDYTLIARNLPLREAGRTLGELDLLLHYLPDNTLEHWELAVKFYLQVCGACWVGPGLRDRLDSKLARLQQHQFPVAESAQARAAIANATPALCTAPLRQYLILPGRLFCASAASHHDTRNGDVVGAISPNHLNPVSRQFWWDTVQGFQHRFGQSSLRWTCLPRLGWLAEYTAGAGSEATGSAEALCNALPDPFLRPVCIAAFTPDGEACRGFLVPDDWPQAARAKVFTN